jgi:hypothetical protein
VDSSTFQEIELDEIVSPLRLQEAAAGEKSEFPRRLANVRFPENMGGGQGGMATRSTSTRGEPAQTEPIRLEADEESGFGEIHLPGDICIHFSSAWASRMQTAAGLPAKGLAVKAST